MTETQKKNHAESKAKAQYESIEVMVERLKHDCETCYDGCEIPRKSIFDALNIFPKLRQVPTEAEMEQYHDEDEARQAIDEDPLSVEVRSGWETPGERLEPAEFKILLCTGGPAVRIRGELNEHGEPNRAWMEFQDWGTPWTRYLAAEQDVLLSYAQCFHYGEGS